MWRRGCAWGGVDIDEAMARTISEMLGAQGGIPAEADAEAGTGTGFEQDVWVPDMTIEEFIDAIIWVYGKQIEESYIEFSYYQYPLRFIIDLDGNIRAEYQTSTATGVTVDIKNINRLLSILIYLILLQLQ